MDEQMNGSNSQNAAGEYPDTFATCASPHNEFDRVMLLLTGYKPRVFRERKPPDGRYAAMRQLLDNRATFNQVRDWRRGKAKAPAWAIALIREKLTARRALDSDALAFCDQHKPGRGQGWKRRASL